MKHKHFTLEDRKTISSCISKKMKCVAIAEELGCDPTSISKELKRNRIESTRTRYPVDEECPLLKRFPHICANCDKKYTKCSYHQFRYDARVAQESADRKLSDSRKGVNLTQNEYNTLVAEVKDGLENKKPIYEIALGLPFSITAQTIYRYIRDEKIPIKSIDLPYAVTYKKRKKTKKEYEYKDSKIDRSNRTFLDYIAFSKESQLYTTQLDFLGSKKGDPYSILTLVIQEIHFVLIFLIKNKNASKVVNIFDEMESKIGLDKFKEIFGLILTDRDPCFADFEGIEISPTNNKQRCNLFYCDAFRSNQKASVENMNKQLRQFFPKGQSLGKLTNERVKQINISLNRRKLASLDGYSPEEAFITVFGQSTFNNLFR